jgi:cell division inhibitor SulA
MSSQQHSAAGRLFAHPLLWRGKQVAHNIQTISTGFAVLDNCLPGHGWPRGAVTELVHGTSGCGELSLLLPALARLSRQNRRIVMIDPPWIPCPAALHANGLALDQLVLVRTHNQKESLWACEQVVRGMAGAAMLAWPGSLSFSDLRRLQLAAKHGRQSVFLFRGQQAAGAPSPSELRLQLNADDGDLEIHILKCRGQRPSSALRIPRKQLFRQWVSTPSGGHESAGAAASTPPKPASSKAMTRTARSPNEPGVRVRGQSQVPG